MAYQNRGGGGNQNRNRQDAPSKWATTFKKEWITVKLTKDAIKFTDDFGRFLSRPLSTSQIRNIYGELKRIQMKGFEEEKTAFLLLKPKLAYATARSYSLKPLSEVFNKAFDAIEEEKHFQNFMDFMEAILAYHKAYGGK